MSAQPGAIVCSIGCCPGCQDCYGMSIGCHQSPCRCDRPCICNYSREDDDPRWRDGCERHDDSDDGRRMAEAVEFYEDINAGAGPFDGPVMNPCEVCGEWGPCGYDDEGRVLIHWRPPVDEDRAPYEVDS